MKTDSYFKHHVFFCLNQRDSPRESCANHQAQDAFKHCKAKVKENNLSGAGVVRINQAGCLDRCAGGPVLVVYPQAVWYTYVDNADIDEIIESHLINGQVVERLRLPDDVGH
jgi:(2Fe-2S) ferredoxin